MKKKLMILGSLKEFVQLTRMAKERGYTTVVVDGYPDSPAKEIADISYDTDVREIPTLATYCQQEKVDGIITSFSDLLLECMVKAADRAHLKCYLKPEQLPWYRDKAAMKKLLTTLHIPTPRHVCLSRGFRDEELAALSFPVVTKPLDMYGSRGLYVLNSPLEVRRYFNKVCCFSKQKQILVEEYNTGYEFNLMAWVCDGIVHILGIADREKSPIGPHEIPISTRNVYPSRLISHVYQPALDVLQKYVSATGQKDGALSMQFFWAPGKDLEVCEIAGRFLGYEHELIEYSSGLSLEKLLLDYVFDEEALKQTLQNHSPFMTHHSAVLYFHGRPGIIANQQAVHEVANWPEVVESQIFYQEGEPVTIHGSNPYTARYYITGRTRAYIDQMTQKIFDTASIKDYQGNEILYPNRMTVYPD